MRLHDWRHSCREVFDVFVELRATCVERKCSPMPTRTHRKRNSNGGADVAAELDRREIRKRWPSFLGVTHGHETVGELVKELRDCRFVLF